VIKLLTEIKADAIEIFGDSILVVNQLLQNMIATTML
jgi:ribonuclease HI